MKRPIWAALAILFFWIVATPGCFFYRDSRWHDHDRDQRWERDHDEHRDGDTRERHGALTPQDEPRQGDVRATQRVDGNANG